MRFNLSIFRTFTITPPIIPLSRSYPDYIYLSLFHGKCSINSLEIKQIALPFPYIWQSHAFDNNLMPTEEMEHVQTLNLE